MQETEHLRAVINHDLRFKAKQNHVSHSQAGSIIRDYVSLLIKDLEEAWRDRANIPKDASPQRQTALSLASSALLCKEVGFDNKLLVLSSTAPFAMASSFLLQQAWQQKHEA